MKQDTIKDTLVALLRTIVPMIVGWLITYGVLPEEVAVQLELLLTAIFTALYYAAIRALSEKWSWFGWLLGHPANPHYDEL